MRPSKARGPSGSENGQVGLRRHVRLRRQTVDDFIDRARVKPGELGHLLNAPSTPSELELAMIKRRCRKMIPPPFRDEVRVEVTRRGNSVTLWERRPLASGPPGQWSRMRIAQLRHEPASGTWSLYWPDGRDKWQPWESKKLKGMLVSLDTVLRIVESDPLGIFFG